MGDKVELTLQERTIIGKQVAKLRSQGLVPGVVYGHDFPATNVSASDKELVKVYHAAGKRQPVELHMGEQKRLAMIKSTDMDPIKHQLRHIAFHVVRQNEVVQTEVPLVIDGSGETPAEKAGLVVLTTLDSVHIEALPKDLPDSLHIDGQRLVDIGDHITVADITAVPGVAILTEPDSVLVTVYEPSALAAKNEAAGGEAEEATTEETEGTGEDSAETDTASTDEEK